MSPYGWYQSARVHLDRRAAGEEAQRVLDHLMRFEPKVASAARERETRLTPARVSRPPSLPGCAAVRVSTVSFQSVSGGNRVMQLTERHREYWRKNLRITAILLAIWFVVTFVVSYYARRTEFQLLWLAVQLLDGSAGRPGDLLLIIWYYARYMGKLDHSIRR